MNVAILCGRLTKEPELKYSSSKPDMAIARYTLAIDRGYGEKKKTIFINCMAFGKAGEFASKYYHKGQRVLIQGEIDITEKDGKYYTNIIVNTQEFADAPKQGTTQATATDPMAGFVDADPFDDDTVPF